VYRLSHRTATRSERSGSLSRMSREEAERVGGVDVSEFTRGGLLILGLAVRWAASAADRKALPGPLLRGELAGLTLAGRDGVNRSRGHLV